MKMNVTTSGLSARRKTIVHNKFFFILMLLLPLAACHEPSRGQERADKITADSMRKPDIKIKVNKRYDEKGNLVGFDSLYSSYYSTAPGDTPNLDSMMNNFEAYFNRSHSTFFNNRMNSLFFSDTLQYPDFFHQDFFRQHYQLNDEYMEDMMQRMDSIKNEFYRRQRKGPLPNGKTL